MSRRWKQKEETKRAVTEVECKTKRQRRAKKRAKRENVHNLAYRKQRAQREYGKGGQQEETKEERTLPAKETTLSTLVSQSTRSNAHSLRRTVSLGCYKLLSVDLCALFRSLSLSLLVVSLLDLYKLGLVCCLLFLSALLLPFLLFPLCSARPCGSACFVYLPSTPFWPLIGCFTLHLDHLHDGHNGDSNNNSSSNNSDTLEGNDTLKSLSVLNK